MSDKIMSERKEVLHGKTYKIRPTGSEYSYYITINSQESNGIVKPREIFFNTKCPEHYEHLMAVTRIISAVFRLADDSLFIADELKEIFSPIGGYRKRDKWYNSLYNEIGEVIELYLLEINAINKATLEDKEIENSNALKNMSWSMYELGN